ncbi:MAG: protease complex subunit PrcB family protein [Acidobacteriota bacterium]|jgi:hypothetical protein|nr:protease complex subunit PrcB family protein [Acidobacteriota bacterium]
MSSGFKISIAGIARAALAIALCLIPVTACSRSARPGGADISLAAVAIALVQGVQRGIGESKSMEAVWISNEKQWNSLIASIPAEALEIPPQPAAVPPDIDFTKYGVLLARMGEKPNGGYRLTLAADKAGIENREAQIPVRWSEPEPGFFYTQAITYPHLVIKVEKGAFGSIAVIDQNGHVKFRLSIPAE